MDNIRREKRTGDEKPGGENLKVACIRRVGTPEEEVQKENPENY